MYEQRPPEPNMGRQAASGFLSGFSGCLGVALAIIFVFGVIIVGCAAFGASQNHSSSGAAQQTGVSLPYAPAPANASAASEAATQRLYRREANLCNTLSSAHWDASSDSCIVIYSDPQWGDKQQYTVAFDSAGHIVPENSLYMNASDCADNNSDTTWHPDTLICSGPGMS